MDITLIKPPAYSKGFMGAQIVPYLGIAYIAASIRQAGYCVDIIDMCGEDIDNTEIINGSYIAHGMPFFRLKNRIKYADVIGLTCMFSQDWVFHRELIQYIHSLFSGAILVAGGEQITAIPEFCLEDCKELDVCILGEGEEVFVALLDALKNRDDLGKTAGLVYRDSRSGAIVRNKRADRIKEIDEIPLPAWDITPMGNYLERELNYHIKRGRTIPMMATRGCPYRCTFCSNSNMWSGPWLVRNPRFVVDEMERYIQEYGANNFVFSDLTAVVTKESIVNLCNEILEREKLNITWQLPTLRTEALDRQVLKLMSMAGCRDVDFAIESGSKDILDAVNKQNDPERMAGLIRDGLSAGINMSVNVVLGLPGETWKDFFKTYIILMKLALAGLQEVNIFPFTPYPGSKLFQELLQRNTIKLNDEYFLSLFAYADLGQAVSWSENFSPRTLRAMRLALFISFYSLMFLSHPKRMMQLVINVYKNRSTTKLEGVLSRIFRDLRAISLKKHRYAKENT